MNTHLFKLLHYKSSHFIEMMAQSQLHVGKSCLMSCPTTSLMSFLFGLTYLSTFRAEVVCTCVCNCINFWLLAELPMIPDLCLPFCQTSLSLYFVKGLSLTTVHYLFASMSLWVYRQCSCSAFLIDLSGIKICPYYWGMQLKKRQLHYQKWKIPVNI